MLTGDRVRVRPFRQDELDMIVQWLESREPAIGPWQPFLLGQGFVIRRALSDNLAPSTDHGLLAIELLPTGQVIGYVRYGIQKIIPDLMEFYDIGYAIADLESRHKGYAREACALVIDYLFATYPVQRVAAFTAAANEPSIRLLERLGFTREGTIRQAMYFDGRWHDIALYAVLRDEWEAPWLKS